MSQEAAGATVVHLHEGRRLGCGHEVFATRVARASEAC